MLDDLKTLLGIEGTDRDDLLNLIIDNTTARLKLLIGGTPPESMDHIILEVSVIRFNRIGSEGMASHSVEGESQSYTDDDFSLFVDEIQAYLKADTGAAKGKVRFI